MQIVYHLGAHVTDEAQIMKCLLKNSDRLAAEGIALPGPNRFRAPISEALSTLNGAPASEDIQSILIDSIIDADDAKRVVMSVDSFLCPAKRVLAGGQFYPMAERGTVNLRQLFPSHEVEFHFAIRNPATFLPALAARVPEEPFRDFIAEVDPIKLRWSDVLARMAAANPQSRLTVWCNEDTPLIWPQVLQAVSGHDPFTELDGVNDFLATIMTKEGVKRMHAYLAENPPQGEMQRQRVTAAFLGKYARPEAIEMELDMTGWTASYVEAMTETYEEDMNAIAGLPGVTFIRP